MANILLADDDKNFGLILKKELEEEHSVDLVADGVEAVLRFVSKPYDFVLLDLEMPRLSGADALKIIKQIYPCVPVITFSGKAGDAEQAESVARGAIKCLTKPFEMEKLRNDIQKGIPNSACQTK